MLFTFPSTLTLLFLAPLVQAGIQQKDFTGIGKIYVLQSEDWRTATPESKIGCLNDHGKIISVNSTSACGVFSRLDDYPYTLSSKYGNCTFEDDTQERNTDSHYGGNDFAWNCGTRHTPDIYDELYTIDGFPYVFLCFGDIACYYDAKRVPESNEVLSLWQYRWGSQQMGITPGHIQLLLLWERLVDLPKREGAAVIPSPRMEIQEGMQVPLQGAKAKI
ncbi:hypothetical protein EK21DRAFT_58697 [Setomelanomma holmii]|uniref:Uncharacterized protein n=1 Tax=Setomelanomma holmii TaxID=210430 RepID=A0A9P4HH02_9PLEO|nr:hypothetical protein EK21DRAFT_58697 [Setomelanomma holmii]